jgi:5-methylcytosine-specific restriction endonuclease McrA
MRRSKYTKAILGPLVQRSRSLADVLRRLGLAPTGGNHRYIQGRIRFLGLDTRHFGGRQVPAIDAIPKVLLEALVARSLSVAGVLRRLGLPLEGRAHRIMTERIGSLSLDTRHFRGAAWARGETRESHRALARMSARRRRPDDEVFVIRSEETNGCRLRRRLAALGWPERCAVCGLSDWQGQPIGLHLDHINGVSNDNRLENLRLLCPNCHSQTDTYCGRNRGAAKAR